MSTPEPFTSGQGPRVPEHRRGHLEAPCCVCIFVALTAILRGLSPHFMAVDTEAQREQGTFSIIESCHFLC